MINFCIQVSFSRFDTDTLNTALEFGDGLIVDKYLYDQSYTKMTKFSGNSKPDDVISLTHELWIQFIVGGRRSDSEFAMKIETIEPEGMINIDLQNYD